MGWYVVVAAIVVVAAVAVRRAPIRIRPAARAAPALRRCRPRVRRPRSVPRHDAVAVPRVRVGKPRTASRTWCGTAAHDDAIRVFDLWVQPSTDEARRTMTCGVVPLPFSVPPIAILARGTGRSVGGAGGRRGRASRTRCLRAAVRGACGRSARGGRVAGSTDDGRAAAPAAVGRDPRARGPDAAGRADCSSPATCSCSSRARRVSPRRCRPSSRACIRRDRARGPYEDRWLQGSWSADPTSADAPEPS